MKIRTKGLVFFLAFAAISSNQFCAAQLPSMPRPPADGGRPLQLSLTNGNVPLSVRITGPDDFVSRVRSWNGRFTIGGTGFGIDWGDGSRSPMREDTGSRESLLSHTYSVPGSYTVSGSAYRPGPDDGPIYSWIGHATVTVGGVTKKGTSLEILYPKGGETFTYQELPKVRWRLTTDRRINLYMQLMHGDQSVADDVVKNISYNLPVDERQFHVRKSFDKYNEALKSGNAKFRLLLRAVDGSGKTVAAKYSGEFTMTPQYVPRIALDSSGRTGGLSLASVGDDNMLVTVSYRVHHPTCFSYILDWGDGTKDTEIKPIGKGAPLNITDTEFKHQYRNSGVYKVTLRSNNHDPFKKLEDIAQFESITVDTRARVDSTSN